jgi:hypothetical protein
MRPNQERWQRGAECTLHHLRMLAFHHLLYKTVKKIHKNKTEFRIAPTDLVYGLMKRF